MCINLSPSVIVLIGAIYKSDSGSPDINSLLLDLISEACNKGDTHLSIMGDVNFRDIEWKLWSCLIDSCTNYWYDYRFPERLQEIFLHQYVTKPTRWRKSDTPHVLDLIIANDDNIIYDLEYQNPLQGGECGGKQLLCDQL